jgi:hypothetical protein
MKAFAVGRVENGVVTLTHKQNFVEQLRGLSGPVVVNVEESDDRLQRLWAYYFAVVVPLAAEYHGYTNEEMHEVWKYEHNSLTVITRYGEEIRTGKTTTRMSKKNQMAFVDTCIQHCAENGIIIPPPEEPSA